MAFQAGNRDSFASQNDHILDLKDGLSFLRPRQDGVALLKKLGMHSFSAKSFKHEWTETALAGRSETLGTVLIGDVTITVADAYIYQVNDLLKAQAEVLRVTAIASATALTVTRGYAGTAAAAQTGKVLMNLGSADPENATAPAGMSDNQSRLYNYVQTFTRSVDLSADEILQASTQGNPLTGNLARRTIEWYQKFAAAMFYGVRYEDAAAKIHVMGGLKQFVTTNVTNVAGALTIALIDAKIKAIVDAGGDPDVIVVGTAQKQKLDALDTNVVRTGKRNSDQVGGGNISQTWQSGVLDHELDVLVDLSILPDELWILDLNYIQIGTIAGNGENGTLAVTDATTPGQDGTRKVIRGKYTMEVMQQLACGYLYGLT